MTNAETTTTSTTATPLLEVTNLSVTVPSEDGELTLVHDTTFTVHEGQTLGVVGESGSGKSMTSLAIMGLLPRGVEAHGSIKLKGKELLGMPERDLRRVRGERIAMIFQDPLSSLNPYYTVGLQIEEAYRAHRGGSRKAARKATIEALDRVKIADAARRVDHYPHQFSGGMRQRIMIAMALCLEPELLIADEPTTALDVTVQAQILDLLNELKEQYGSGMLFITHDLAVVSQIADDVTVMKDGHQVEYGTAEQIFSRPQAEYTKALLEALPRIDDPFQQLKGVGE
ncbi:ABC transporter ATP-binding protein [Lysinibacter cavernae]|uniref:Peptide/nickel transport system ATP-binding protein n=1 Tax=Lysinibacter cavernae TaxID=1640652 RepID=A0A7X5QYU7_9MICO|nr:ABC transporter ATP-binding protein [Lysinibacter cavernae]NIH52307.1 peptide/nickel transport system ATP-binding protein [Lysinibacter cavernae]